MRKPPLRCFLGPKRSASWLLHLAPPALCLVQRQGPELAILCDRLALEDPHMAPLGQKPGTLQEASKKPLNL